MKKGIEYPFRFDALSLPTLMHRQEESLFGRIEFYTQLKNLVAFLSGCQNQPWIICTPELSNVMTFTTLVIIYPKSGVHYPFF